MVKNLPAKSSKGSQKDDRRRWAAVILAAGSGKRMKSKLPKPLCPVAGRAMVLRVLDSLKKVAVDPIVVVIGHQAELVRSEVLAKNSNSPSLVFATQKYQLGTGDAVFTGLAALKKKSAVTDLVVLNGDMPLLRAGTVIDLFAEHTAASAKATLLTASLEDPSGYGRIMRTSDGRIAQIVEESDADVSQKRIKEVNAGAYCFCVKSLERALTELRPTDSRSEFYLTGVIEFFIRVGWTVSTMTAVDSLEVMGVNDAAQLAACERIASRYVD